MIRLDLMVMVMLIAFAYASRSVEGKAREAVGHRGGPGGGPGGGIEGSESPSNTRKDPLRARGDQKGPREDLMRPWDPANWIF